LASLRIPLADKAGLKLIRQLTEDQLVTFIAELERNPAAEPEVPGVHPKDVTQIVGTLERLYQVRGYGEVSIDEFVSDISEALRESDELSPSEEQSFRGRLTRLLDIEALNIAAKATDLAQEYLHLFCTARILTDARPIFGTDPSAAPSAMVITHTLKIDYHEGTDMKEIYLAIGSGDISELREVLDRAEAKAVSLRKMLESAKMRIIDPQQ
jgi:hypothetical protein